MSIEFTKSLIKGRIAEIIFDQMFREENEFTVIPLGYEQTLPTLAQYQHLAEIKGVIENISDAPDFALVSNDKTRVFLVEVKYRSHMKQQDIYECAEELSKRWNPSWLFVATPNKFYFSPSNDILRLGNIKALEDTWVGYDVQQSYLDVLNEFEK